MCLSLQELMYAMSVQVPREAEDTGSPGGSPDISSCETPDIATENKNQDPLGEQGVEPSFQPLSLILKTVSLCSSDKSRTQYVG